MVDSLTRREGEWLCQQCSTLSLVLQWSGAALAADFRKDSPTFEENFVGNVVVTAKDFDDPNSDREYALDIAVTGLSQIGGGGNALRYRSQ